jgi:hypothetical protein
VKAAARFRGIALTVYALELCFYGERGDYEVFPDRELGLDLESFGKGIADRGWDIEEGGTEVIMFREPEGPEYTLYPDGRLIIEGLKPGSPEQAWTQARGILGFDAVA